MKRAIFALCVTLFFCGIFVAAARAQNPAACCSITAIDAGTGNISGKVNATGQTFVFRVTDAKLLPSLRIGQAVYANLGAKQVSLDGKSIAGPIVSIAAAPLERVPLTKLPALNLPRGTGGSSPSSGSGAAGSGSSGGGSAPAVATVCAGPSTVEGVDVSEFQGSVDWMKVKASGRAFAYARAGDGNYRDPTFSGNYAAIKAAGLLRGAYQHFNPFVDPVAQANNLLAAIGGQPLGPGDLPAVFVVDILPGSTSGQGTVEPSAADMATFVNSWMASIKARSGRTPIVMFSTFLVPAFPTAALSSFSSYPLWAPAYTAGGACPPIPTAWPKWAFWQYSDTGAVPGISGNVDLDRFNGALSDLQSLAK